MIAHCVQLMLKTATNFKLPKARINKTEANFNDKKS